MITGILDKFCFGRCTTSPKHFSAFVPTPLPPLVISPDTQELLEQTNRLFVYRRYLNILGEGTEPVGNRSLKEAALPLTAEGSCNFRVSYFRVSYNDTPSSYPASAIEPVLEGLKAKAGTSNHFIRQGVIELPEPDMLACEGGCLEAAGSQCKELVTAIQIVSERIIH